MSTQIAVRPNVEQIVEIHDKAYHLYELAFEKLDAAREALHAAYAMERLLNVDNTTNTYAINHVDEVKAFHNALNLPSREDYLRVASRVLNLKGWAYIIERTNLEMLMDKEAKDKLRQQMAYVQPQVSRAGEIMNQADLDAMMAPFTAGNIHATIDGFMADASTIWRRGIANVFSKLDRRFRSHDGFKIGSRVILTRAFNEWGSWDYGTNTARDSLIDIERIFHIMEGEKPPTAVYAGAIGSIDDVRGFGGGKRQSEVETIYFKVRIFQNGNAHLWFKDKELIARVNREIGLYYGEVLGNGMQAEEDPLANVKNTPARNYGFFPTPEPAVEHVFKHISPLQAADKPALRILEPSAGTGNLARRCVDALSHLDKWSGGREAHAGKHHARNLVDCVEIQGHLANDLKSAGIYHKVYNQDFLTLSPDTTGLYDMVIANPPFDRERDIDHVMHMAKFLTPGGTLVAIMSAGTEFRETKKSAAFRAFIEKKKGKFFDLPAGSFSEVGTNTNTIIVKFHNDGHPVSRW